MKHNLNISVSKKPPAGGIIQCRNVSLREKLLTRLLGRRATALGQSDPEDAAASAPAPAAPPAPAPADLPPKAITLEEVRAVLAERSHDGYTDQVRGLLQKYGAEKLSGVDPKHYAALMKDAEVLGHAT